MKRLILLRATLLRATLLVTLLALVGTGAVWARDVVEEPFEKSVAVAASGRVTVSNTNGHVSVEAWSGSEVQISATKKARARDETDAREMLEDIRIEISESGGNVTIETELPRMKGWFGGGSASVEYAIKVPATVELRLKSTNGKIEVEGVEGLVDVKTTNGSISARSLGGALIAETTNGKVEALDVVGPIDAETTNGSIRAEVTAASLDEDMELSTTNGGVELGLAAGITARIDARAGNGSVKSDLPVSAESEKRNALSGYLNGGGNHTIRIRTSNGSIRLREL